MLILWAIVALITAVVSYTLWPRSERTAKTVAIAAALFGGVVSLMILTTQLWPQDHIKVEVIQKKYVNPPKVVFKDRIIYKAPDGRVAPVNVKAACEGSIPLQIVKLSEANDKTDDKDSTTTWIVAHPVGSDVLITCGEPGAYADFWSVGDVVQITRGVPQ